MINASVILMLIWQNREVIRLGDCRRCLQAAVVSDGAVCLQNSLTAGKTVKFQLEPVCYFFTTNWNKLNVFSAVKEFRKSINHHKLVQVLFLDTMQWKLIGLQTLQHANTNTKYKIVCSNPSLRLILCRSKGQSLINSIDLEWQPPVLLKIFIYHFYQTRYIR